MFRRLGFITFFLFLTSCTAEKQLPPAFPVDQLGEIQYIGTQSGTVRLVAGVWQGDPYVEGAEERPEVDLAGTDPMLGDLDGDGQDEAVVVLTEQTGGSGIFVYFAVVDRRGDELTNVATALLGDRVAISSMRMEERILVAELVVAGPGDTACCPTHRQERRWRLDSGQLREMSRSDIGRIERD